MPYLNTFCSFCSSLLKQGYWLSPHGGKCLFGRSPLNCPRIKEMYFMTQGEKKTTLVTVANCVWTFLKQEVNMMLNWAPGSASGSDIQHHHITFPRLAQRKAASELLRWAMKGNLCFSIISFLREPQKQNCTGIHNSNWLTDFVREMWFYFDSEKDYAF